MIDVTIRKATLQDIPGLVQLLEQLFSVEEDFNFNRKKQEMGLRLLIMEERRAFVFVAEAFEEIIGMVTAQVSISTAEGNYSFMLEDMVVDKQFRGKGVGKLLMEAVRKKATELNINRIQLLADKTNTSALAFYDKLGWQKTLMICLRKYVEIS